VTVAHDSGSDRFKGHRWVVARLAVLRADSSLRDESRIDRLGHLLTRPMLDCLGYMGGADHVGTGQIGNGPGELEGSMEGAGSEMKLLHSGFELY
jgi:hypothetical protein